MQTALMKARAAQHAQLIRQVHAAKTALGLDDDTYRCTLARFAAGKRSSKLCSVAELKALVEHFHESGWPRPGKMRKPLSPSQKKMWALWQKLADQGRVRDRRMPALLKWIEHQTDNHVQRLEFLTPAQEHTLIESLKQWSERP